MISFQIFFFLNVKVSISSLSSSLLLKSNFDQFGKLNDDEKPFLQMAITIMKKNCNQQQKKEKEIASGHQSINDVNDDEYGYIEM